MQHDLQYLKRQVPLLQYLMRHSWKARQIGSHQEFVGLCPLHLESRPSFYVNACKNVFYCHGCGRGGDVIRFVQLYLNLSFNETLAHLKQELGLPEPSQDEVLEEAVDFYRCQLQRHSEALDYLHCRGLHDPELIRQMGIGYAPGATLRRHLIRLGYSSKRFSLSRLNESRLLDYVRHQLESLPKPTPQTVNHRLTVVRRLYRFHYGCEIPRSRASIQSIYKTRNPLGYGRPGRAGGGLRLKQPRRVVVPLSSEEVFRFWSSFRTFRDLSITALMLFNGLRSHEIIELQLEQLRLSQAQFYVRGKGNKERVLPLADDTIQTLEHYLEIERPRTNSPYLFLSLKGLQRGCPLTPAGLRSLFRHHRGRFGLKSLRRAGAVLLAERGAPIAGLVKRFCEEPGHSVRIGTDIFQTPSTLG